MKPIGTDGAPRHDLPFSEFIVLMALLMALTALSIDIMLPALPDIGRAFGLTRDNDRQLVVASYLIGLAVGQIVWGPLSDRMGRRKPLLMGLVMFVAGSVMSLTSGSFEMLIAARLLQGFGGASARVIATAIVRDLYSGRTMAGIMSTVMMVFIMVPIFAPAIGQTLQLVFGSWRAGFFVLFATGVAASVWSGLRLPETLTRKPGVRRPTFLEAARLVVTTPVTLGYGLGAGFMFGCLATYITSAQQVFVDVYDLGRWFPLAFGGIASAMALAAFTNARLVHRLGMRRLSHTALCAFLVTSAILTLLVAVGFSPLWVTAPALALCFYLFGLIQPNFNAIAMQPMGHVAGMAASLTGAYTTFAGAVAGSLIARSFSGTPMHLAAGFLLLAFLALIVVIAVEGPRGLFRGE